MSGVSLPEHNEFARSLVAQEIPSLLWIMIDQIIFRKASSRYYIRCNVVFVWVGCHFVAKSQWPIRDWSSKRLPDADTTMVSLHPHQVGKHNALLDALHAVVCLIIYLQDIFARLQCRVQRKVDMRDRCRLEVIIVLSSRNRELGVTPSNLRFFQLHTRIVLVLAPDLGTRPTKCSRTSTRVALNFASTRACSSG